MPTELLNDYDFQPNIREIRNQIQLAYYEHDDYQLASCVNQLGKALEVYGYYQEAQKCHYLDARISLYYGNESGFLIALANLVLSFGMAGNSDEESDEELDLGFFRLLHWEVGCGPDIQELVWRKFIFAVHYASAGLCFPDFDAVCFFRSCGYLDLLEDYKHETNYWECLIAAVGTLIQFGFVQEAQTYMTALSLNRGCFKHSALTTLAYYEVTCSSALLTEGSIGQGDLDGFSRVLRRVVAEDAQEAGYSAQRFADAVIAFSACEYADFAREQLKLAGQLKAAQYFSASLSQLPDCGAMSADERLVYFINHNKAFLDVDPDAIQHIAHYHVHYLLKSSCTPYYREQAAAAAFGVVVDGLDRISADVQFGRADLLAIAARQLLAHYDFQKPKALIAMVKTAWHVVKGAKNDDDQLDDFVEQLLNCFYRNDVMEMHIDEGILDAMHIQTGFSLKFCLDKLAESIGYSYNEDNAEEKLTTKCSIDDLMIASGLIQQRRQSQKQIFQSATKVKQAPGYKKRRSLQRIAKNDGSKEVLQSLSYTSPAAEKSRTFNRDIRDFIVNNSETQSITDSSDSAMRSSEKPKILTKSITSSSIISNHNNVTGANYIGDLRMDDLYDFANTAVLTPTRYDRPTTRNTVNSAPSIQYNTYQQFQRFVAENGYESLSAEQKIQRYHEFLLLYDLLSYRSYGSGTQGTTYYSPPGDATNRPCVLPTTAISARENQPLAETLSNFNEPLSFHTNARLWTDRIFQRAMRCIYLRGLSLDGDICTAIEQQATLEELELVYCFQKTSYLAHSIIQMRGLKQLRLHIYDMSATEVMNIVVSAAAERMHFSGAIGMDSPAYEVVNSINQRHIERLWFTRCNFFQLRTVDVIAGILEISELGFWECLYKERLQAALRQTCEVTISETIGN